MDELLLKQDIRVDTDLDRVVLWVGRTDFPMPYAQAIKISAGLRLGSKQIMQICGVGAIHWASYATLDTYAQIPDLSLQKRTTQIKKYDWRIDAYGEHLKLWLDNVLVEIHFTVGLKLSEWLRVSARTARNWAGDNSKQRVAMGILNDAEYNYKHGLNKVI